MMVEKQAVVVTFCGQSEHPIRYNQKMGRPEVKPDRIHSFIDYDDTIIKYGRRFYKASCKECGSDRGYKRPNKFDAVCDGCQTKLMRLGVTEESRKKQSESMIGTVPWNKGKSGYLTRESRQKISDSQIKYDCEGHRKLRKTMSSLINQKFKRRLISNGKCKLSMPEYLPYSFQDLVVYIESKFKPGMTWENHGEWHLDHKIPDSWFIYSSVEDQGFKDSWALSNLQPLWAIDNLKKHNRRSS